MVMAALPSHDATSDDDNEGDDYGQLPIIDTTACQILIPRLDAPSEPEDDTPDIVNNNDEEIEENMAKFFDVLTDEGIGTIFDDLVLDDCVPEDDEPQESPMASTLVSPNAPAIIPLATSSGFPEAPVVGPSTRSRRQSKVGPLKRRPKKTQKIKKTQFRYGVLILHVGCRLPLVPSSSNSPSLSNPLSCSLTTSPSPSLSLYMLHNYECQTRD